MSINGTDVTHRIAFLQPDDGNTDDRTVIRVPVPIPLAPHDTTRIEISFESQIPQAYVRTGWWQDDFFLLAHWFPKIGVYEPPGTRLVPADAPRGRWNCHQFHAATEFYSDFGTYDVQITLPDKYVVGTTGLIISERSNGDGTKTIFARAEDVHEFAWVADAQLLEAHETWTASASDQSVNIRLLYQPGHEDAVKRYMQATKGALDYVEQWLGPRAYPYPNLTIVDPRPGSGAGGMEYPTLITGGANWFAQKLMGDGLRMTEIVTIHEFMHQFWYGIVGNNEFEEAWLDEGFTSYSDARISSDLYGDKTSLLNWWGLTAGGTVNGRAQYCFSSRLTDGSITDWTFSHWDGYVGLMMAYGKSNLMLATLENYLGRDRFDQIMRAYFQRWKFRHPTGKDFVAVANEVAGENLDWFFDQVINQKSSLDYAVASITNLPVEDLEVGILGDELVLPLKVEDEEDDDDDDVDTDDTRIHHCKVVFRRVGEIVFPVETLVEFSDGEVVRQVWDGRDRIKVYSFTRPGKVVRAAVDPDYRIPLDTNFLNNSLRIEENAFVKDKYTAKGFFWMQSLLQFFSLLG